MKKILAVCLSINLLMTSILPAMAKIRPMLPTRGAKNFQTGLRKINPTANRPLAQTHLLRSKMGPQLMRTNAGVSVERILQEARWNARLPLSLPKPESTNLRANFVPRVVHKAITPQDIKNTRKAYRLDLIEALSSTEPVPLPFTSKVAEIHALGIVGSAEVEATDLLKVAKESIGKPEEAGVVAAASRALLRLGAYEELAQLSELSTLQPELWRGIEVYAQKYRLPVRIAKKERKAVDVTHMRTLLSPLGEHNVEIVDPSLDCTIRYMNIGKQAPQTKALAKNAPQTSEKLVAKAAERGELRQESIAEDAAAKEVPLVSEKPVVAEESKAAVEEGPVRDIDLDIMVHKPRELFKHLRRDPHFTTIGLLKEKVDWEKMTRTEKAKIFADREKAVLKDVIDCLRKDIDIQKEFKGAMLGVSLASLVPLGLSLIDESLMFFTVVSGALTAFGFGGVLLSYLNPILDRFRIRQRWKEFEGIDKKWAQVPESKLEMPKVVELDHKIYTDDWYLGTKTVKLVNGKVSNKADIGVCFVSYETREINKRNPLGILGKGEDAWQIWKALAKETKLKLLKENALARLGFVSDAHARGIYKSNIREYNKALEELKEWNKAKEAPKDTKPPQEL